MEGDTILYENSCDTCKEKDSNKCINYCTKKDHAFKLIARKGKRIYRTGGRYQPLLDKDRLFFIRLENTKEWAITFHEQRLLLKAVIMNVALPREFKKLMQYIRQDLIDMEKERDKIEKGLD